MRRPQLLARVDRVKLVNGATVIAAGTAVCIAAFAMWRFNKLMPLGYLLTGNSSGLGS